MTLEDFSEAFRKFQKEYPAAVAQCLLDDATHFAIGSPLPAPGAGRGPRKKRAIS